MKEDTIKGVIRELLKELETNFNNEFINILCQELNINSISGMAEDWYRDRVSDKNKCEINFNCSKYGKLQFIFTKNKEKKIISISYVNKNTKTEIQSPPFD